MSDKGVGSESKSTSEFQLEFGSAFEAEQRAFDDFARAACISKDSELCVALLQSKSGLNDDAVILIQKVVGEDLGFNPGVTPPKWVTIELKTYLVRACTTTLGVYHQGVHRQHLRQHRHRSLPCAF